METRFALVGTGRITDWVLKGALLDSRFKVKAVCSRSEHTALAFIEKHSGEFEPDCRAFTDVSEMAACQDIDAVYIGTPNATHCDIAVKCLEAGKHVLCEKPLASSADEVRRMIAAARKSGKVLMEAMISTLNPNFAAAREALPEIGKVRLYNSSFCQYSSKYEALKKGIVSNSFNPRMGGGAMEDIGIYTVFPAVSLFGRPDAVRGRTITLSTSEGDVDIQGTIELSYPDFEAVLTYSKIADSSLPTQIGGEEGSVTLDQIHICRKASLTRRGAPTSGRGPADSSQVLREGLEMDEYYYEFREFLDVIGRGALESDVNSLEVSLLAREVMDAAKSCGAQAR